MAAIFPAQPLPIAERAFRSATPLLANAAPSVSPQVMSGLGVTGDQTYAVRSALDQCETVNHPLLRPLFLKSSIEYHGLGITTGMMAVNGGIEFKRAASAFRFAVKHNQSFGQIASAFLDLITAGLKFVIGAAFIAYRHLSIARAIKISQGSYVPTSLFGKIVAQFANVCWGMLSAFYILLFFPTVTKFYRDARFKLALYMQPAGERLNFLTGELMRRRGIAEAKVRAMSEGNRLELARERMVPVLEELSRQAALQQINFPQPGPGGWSAVVDALFEGHDGRATALNIGEEIARQIFYAAADEEYSALVGSDCLAELNRTQPNQAVAVAKAQSTGRQNLAMDLYLIANFALNAAAFILMLLPTCGTNALIISTIFLLFGVIDLAISSYQLHGALKGNFKVGRNDERALIAHILLGLVAITVTLTLTSIFTYALFPIVLTAVSGGLWIGLDLYLLYKVRQNRRIEAEAPARPAPIAAEDLREMATQIQQIQGIFERSRVAA